MRDRPSGADLLAIARETFTREILSALGAEHRLTALMIANAMGIAERDMAGDGARALRHDLAAFYGEEIADEEGADAQTLERLCRRLARDVRAGRFRGDATRHLAAYRLLLDDARARVAASNPKYLRE